MLFPCSGYAWVYVLNVSLQQSFALTLMSANALSALFLFAFSALPTPPGSGKEKGDKEEEEGRGKERQTLAEPLLPPGDVPFCSPLPSSSSSPSSKTTPSLPFRRRLAVLSSLYPLTLPLFLVFFSEYALQSGVWSATGFPVQSESSRKDFYLKSNWLYQGGVFLSRSSGSVFPLPLKVVQSLPLLQFFLLILFTLSATSVIPLPSFPLLSLSFVAGLFGGGVYVNAFSLISDKFGEGQEEEREVAMGGASAFDGLGILLADFVGLFLQSCIYKFQGIDGAKATCPW